MKKYPWTMTLKTCPAQSHQQIRCGQCHRRLHYEVQYFERGGCPVSSQHNASAVPVESNLGAQVHSVFDLFPWMGWPTRCPRWKEAASRRSNRPSPDGRRSAHSLSPATASGYSLATNSASIH